YVTAASTPFDQSHGFTILDCRITAAEGVKTYLGRPSRAHAHTAIVRTEISAAVPPAGWHNWGQPDRELTTRYLEVASRGDGAANDARVAWARAIADPVGEWSAAAILAGDDDWQIPLPISR